MKINRKQRVKNNSEMLGDTIKESYSSALKSMSIINPNNKNSNDQNT